MKHHPMLLFVCLEMAWSLEMWMVGTEKLRSIERNVRPAWLVPLGANVTLT